MEGKEDKIKKIFQSKLNKEENSESENKSENNIDTNTVKIISYIIILLLTYTSLFLSYVILDKKFNFPNEFNFGEGLVLFSSLYLLKIFLWKR